VRADSRRLRAPRASVLALRASTHLVALGPGAAACSDTTGGGGGNTLAALTPDTFAPTYYRTVCEMLFRCPTFGDGGFAVALLQNPATCASKLPSFGVGSVADLLTFVRGGTVRFDGAAASMCIARIQRSCFGVDADFDALCSAAFRGTVVEGGACWRSDECASGFFCDHGSGTRACPGACRPSRGADASCTIDRQCAGWETGVAACVEGVCATTHDGAAAGENQGCGVLAGSPARRVGCAAGLACVTGLCRRPTGLGAPCLSIDACVPGATCALVPGTTMRSCASPAALVRSTPVERAATTGARARSATPSRTSSARR
jgi:hypothetical protein